MIVRMEAYARRLKHKWSRSAWLAKILKLSLTEDAANRPGLVMIQIDGLAHAQVERAMKEGRMPFLSRLKLREGYRQHIHYAGLPSNTPAVQGALFYGIKACVPAFSFKQRQSGQMHMLFNPVSAISVQTCLEEKTKAPGLLDGGSAYGDIFTGGAKEAHFCAAGMGWGSFFQAVNPFGIPLTIILNLHVALRAVFFAIIEFFIALIDCVRGIISGKSILKELSFIPVRMLVCIILRDANTEGAKIDIARGLPIIHVNFGGFDEQAHHRGPGSRFARWSLKGIDNAIRDIYKAARFSHTRDYDVFIYSDHGQEDVRPYRVEYGRSIQDAVTEIFKEKIESQKWKLDFQRDAYHGRAYLMRNPVQKAKTVSIPPLVQAEQTQNVVVSAMGPVGHIYPPVPLERSEKEKMAEALVAAAKIPFVIVPDGEGQATAWNEKGKWALPDQGAEVIDPKHPFFNRVVEDLVKLAHHEDAGEILIFGWRENGLKPLTFMGEYGSHAGPGPTETGGFALLPSDALPLHKGDVIETLDLREAAQNALKRDDNNPFCVDGICESAKTLRLMTYNVHGCLGRDGKLLPARIARIIARQRPDIVCLQELDVHDQVEQAEILSKKLAMPFHYSLAKERRGNAILSRYPMKLVKTGLLPRLANTRLLEPRGAVWVELDVAGKKIQLINTHLSLSPQEAFRQASALVGPEWAGGLKEKSLTLVCGDFNAALTSKVCSALGHDLKNVQTEIKNHRMLKTLPSYYPIRTIDHVYAGAGLKPVKVEVPNTDLECVASDHLPLVAELEIL